MAQAPLIGAHFVTDARKVHQLLKAQIQGGPAEHWIYGIAHHQNGQRNMVALWQHFAGKGNLSRCIAETENPKATLAYKHERTMPFTTFLDSFQKMATIYKEEGKPLLN